MPEDQSGAISELLHHWAAGDERALTSLLPLVYQELLEISEVLGLSRATVDRDWATARAWLHRRMSRAGSS